MESGFVEDGSDVRGDRIARLGCGWFLVFLGVATIAAAIAVALTPRAPPEWRPMSEFGYGPHFDFPLWMYPVPIVLAVATIFFATPRAKHPTSWPLVVGLGVTTLGAGLMLSHTDSLLGPAHLDQYRAECAAGSIAGCIAVSECAPERSERVQALERWCEIDPRFGCSALGASRVRSADWAETPTYAREGRVAQGIALLTSACERGAPNACEQLSGIYRSGRYVPVDVERADHFYQAYRALMRAAD